MLTPNRIDKCMTGDRKKPTAEIRFRRETCIGPIRIYFRHLQYVFAIVCKATFRLEPGVCVLAEVQEDPAGGDVALPVSYLRDADRVWIRASTRMAPTVFKVNRFDDALDEARAEGCTEASFKSTS